MKPIIVDEDTGRRLWRGAECAEYCGVSASTWRSYGRRIGYVPTPVAHLDERTPLWWADEVEQFQATRPGRGTRTDLK
ncbi:helix-turn-helix DNA binding domain protein [Gordonia phage Finkle]|uniref:Helix-turn-helix DNA binding domain protein n=1 Tax=Gordonia phage Finkle TaxID=2926099 RepID=A0A9E7NKK9_9CAUD|nr:helix-turn-helix DNA binding domain protein [Gordonia phage Finkle]UTN92954.1 helix-turn-helix DNA binding domain protein [Gordonia phage Finkle]